MILPLLATFYFLSGTSAQTNSLNVSLYYESLCPDSEVFVTTQLYPAYQTLKDYLVTDFVPYGFAQATNQSGNWTFTCQHGPRECYGNEIQSCVVQLYPERSVEFINCAMAGDPSDDTVLTECCEKSGIEWKSVKECYDSGLAAKLLVENGRRTSAVTPKINYVPTIIFNGVYNKTLQDLGEHHFFTTACLLLQNQPDSCRHVVQV